MKKKFEFEENVKYYHEIEVDVEDEDDFENFAEYIGNCVDSGQYDEKDEIIAEFAERFGDDNVTFIEGCPSVEIN